MVWSMLSHEISFPDTVTRDGQRPARLSALVRAPVTISAAAPAALSLRNAATPPAAQNASPTTRSATRQPGLISRSSPWRIG
jgi:hypothetical protein